MRGGKTVTCRALRLAQRQYYPEGHALRQRSVDTVGKISRRSGTHQVVSGCSSGVEHDLAKVLRPAVFTGLPSINLGHVNPLGIKMPSNAAIAALLVLLLAGCAATASPPNSDGKHELETDPWERVGQEMGRK